MAIRLPGHLAERRRVRESIDALQEEYDILNAEFDRRATAKWREEVAVIRHLPPDAAKLVAVEILLSDPESLEDDVLESALYMLRDRLQATGNEAG